MIRCYRNQTQAKQIFARQQQFCPTLKNIITSANIYVFFTRPITKYHFRGETKGVTVAALSLFRVSAMLHLLFSDG